MEPKLVTKPAFYVIGYELKTKNEGGQNNEDIPEFWQQYMQNRLGSKIPNPINENTELGICTDFNPETGEFVYVIGMEVEKDTPAPEGTVYRSFPELEYAVFTTPKSNEESFTSSIQSTWNYVLQNGSLNRVMSTTDQWSLNCMIRDAMVQKTKRSTSTFL